jgi:LmbE family N-acetylglucosaminyl deacetylase
VTTAPTQTAVELAEPDLIEDFTANGHNRALIVMAHPDDNEFVCGGTVAKLGALGWRIHLVVTTSGNKGTKDPTVTGQQLAAEREEEQRRAAEILGAEQPTFFGFPDGYVENSDELRGLIVRQLRLHRPDLVITWDGFRPGFNHRDHRRTGRATYDAIYPAGDDHLYYPRDKEEALQPHRPRALLLAGAGEPDYHVDVTPVIRTKIRAALAHTSQLRNRSEDDMLARYRDRALDDARRLALAEARPFDEADALATLTYRESFRLVRFG